MSRSHGTELQMFRGRDKLRSRTQKRIEGKTCIVGLSYTEKAIEVKKLEEFIDRENVGVSFLKKWIKGGMTLGDMRDKCHGCHWKTTFKFCLCSYFIVLPCSVFLHT